MLDVDALLEELTLAEKISLLAGANAWQTAAVERLQIPAITVSDGPNGVRGTRFLDSVPSNCFPCGTGLASTFNKELLFRAGQLMAAEAKMKGVHCILGPTCNIARGPLGGRVFESYSEDPALLGHAAAAVVRGIQSAKVAACLKHYVCNDQETERHAVDVRVSERALREVYLKPFQLAVRDAAPRALMTAYNRVNGEHASQLAHLLRRVLRDDWRWDGMVMSDWYGTYLCKQALEAGLNLEMPGPARMREATATAQRVACGELGRGVVDSNVRRVLTFVARCAEAGVEAGAERENRDPAAARVLRTLAAEAAVLLKNDGALPWAARAGEVVAVIGPNARAARNLGGGSASLRARYTVTPYDGIERAARAHGARVEYALGAHLDKTVPDIGGAVTTAAGAAGFDARFYRDAPGSAGRTPFDTRVVHTSRLFLSDYKHPQLPPGEQLFYVDFEGYYTARETATYLFGCSCLGTAQLFVDDELVVDNKTTQVRGDAFFLGMGTREERACVRLAQGQTCKISVLFGTRPTSRLPLEYEEVGGVYFGVEVATADDEALRDAVALARRADKVVVVTGLAPDWESEGFDRALLHIPGRTNHLVRAVAAANPNVVVVNQSGSPVALPWIDDVRAVVQAWYGGNELGNAIADVLFGAVNPSGKLALSFPECVEHNPSFLNFGSADGHVLYGEDVFVGYRYYDMKKVRPLFAFGHGLSYTSFVFGAVSVAVGDALLVSLDVTNSGPVRGAEVVQVYVHHKRPKVLRPVKELKDFAKVFLDPGETKPVRVAIPMLEATSYWDSAKNMWLSEKGDYQVQVGLASDLIASTADFTVEKSTYWLGA